MRTCDNECHRIPGLQVVLDATLANMVCGWLPPFRPKMLRTLKAPQFSQSPCTHPGCRIRGCFGNVSWETGGDLFFK